MRTEWRSISILMKGLIDTMWYVVQVRTGSEENIRQQCEVKIEKEVLKSCFIPTYEEKRHIRGEWITLRKILFPGYLFVITEEIDELYRRLKMIIGLTKLLGTGHEIVALTEKEKNFLQTFGGNEHVVRMSEGIIEQSQIKVTSGPLVGMEGYIRKIDRHKRKGWIELEMFGRTQRIQVGLEIVAKK